MNTYLVTYQIQDTDEVVTEEVEAHDEACALGLVLDDLEDDDTGSPPPLHFVTIRSAAVVMPLDTLPESIRKAWVAGLIEHSAEEAV